MLNTKAVIFRVVLLLCSSIVGIALALGARGLYLDWTQRKGSLDARRIDELRTKLDANPKALFRFDPLCSYAFKSSFVGTRYWTKSDLHTTDSRGLLGFDEVDLSPGRKRMLVMGDSVAYGNGVAFESIFTQLLQDRLGPMWQVKNGSCPGWSTRQEIQYFGAHWNDIPWDMVIIAFCFNDLVEYEWVYDSEEGYKMAEAIVRDGGGGGVTDTLRSLRIASMRRRFKEEDGCRYLADQSNTILLAWDEDAWERFEKNVFQDNKGHLLQKAECVLVIPTLPQLQSLRHHGRRDLVLFPQQRMRALMASKGTRVIDLTDAFEHYSGNPRSLFLPSDPLHLSVKGHALAADALHAALRGAAE